MNIAYACLQASEYKYNYNYDDGVVIYSKTPVYSQPVVLGESGNESTLSYEVIETYQLQEFLETQSSYVISILLTVILLLGGILYIINNWNNLSKKRTVLIPITTGVVWFIIVVLPGMLVISCPVSVTFTASSPYLNVLRYIYTLLPVSYLLILLVHIGRFSERSKEKLNGG